MKNNLKLFTALVLFLGFLVSGCSNSDSSLSGSKSKPVIGVAVGTFYDTWRTIVRNQIYQSADGKAVADIWSGNDSPDTENQKIDIFIKRKVNALVVNLVDKNSAGVIIEKAKKADIPVIFFNNQPSPQDLEKWDKAYYVGAKGEQSGIMQGQILVNYFKNYPAKDGTIDCVMLQGPLEHQDARLRSQYSIQAMKDAGLKVNLLAQEIAMWNREQGQKKMDSFLAAYGDRIDCVLANNDDMALGAIDALKGKGYFKNSKYLPVVGVDATSSALHAAKNGYLLGTVLNDAVNQGKAIFNLAYVLAQGQIPSRDNVGYAITDGKYIWIDYKVITKENIDEAK